MMTALKALIQKEIRQILFSKTVSLFLAVLLSVSFFMFFRTFFLQGQLDMRPYFDILPLFLVFFLPALSMRSMSEESSLGTLEILMTSPAKTLDIIVSKLFAMLVVMMVFVCMSLPVPFFLSLLGNLDWGVVISSYLGVVLFSLYALALGLFFSSLSSNQISAFISTGITLFLLFLIGQPIVYFSAPSFLVPFITLLSFTPHYEVFVRGVIGFSEVFYFLSFSSFFLVLTFMVIESKRR